MIILSASEGVRDAVIDEAIRLGLEDVRRSRTQPSCNEHGVHLDGENPRRLRFCEESNRSARDAHFAVPASAEFVNALAAEPPSMEIHPIA